MQRAAEKTLHQLVEIALKPLPALSPSLQLPGPEPIPIAQTWAPRPRLSSFDSACAFATKALGHIQRNRIAVAFALLDFAKSK